MDVRTLLIVLIALIACPVRGQVRENPKGPRQIEVRSADRAQVLSVDFDKCTMTLHAGEAPARWTVALQADDLIWPQFWVHDRGWVARVDRFNQVTIHEPEHGKPVMSVSLHKEFARHGWSRYVQDVTDRPHLWETHAIWAFREVQGVLCFVVRPWWGDRVIFDLQNHRLIDDLDEAHDELVKQDTEWVLSTLREAAAGPAPDDHDPRPPGSWELFRRARMAAHLAGQLKVAAAVEPLKVLETWEYTDVSGSIMGDPVEAGALNPRNYSVNTLRQAVQLSLRRLGVPPTGNAPITLNRYHPDRKGAAAIERVAFPRPDLPRPAGAKSVRVGMTVQQLGELLGGPDGIVKGAWEYDIEEGSAKTLRVSWKAGLVSAVERVAPRWHSDTVRDEEFLY